MHAGPGGQPVRSGSVRARCGFTTLGICIHRPTGFIKPSAFPVAHAPWTGCNLTEYQPAPALRSPEVGYTYATYGYP